MLEYNPTHLDSTLNQIIHHSSKVFSTVKNKVLLIIFITIYELYQTNHGYIPMILQN